MMDWIKNHKALSMAIVAVIIVVFIGFFVGTA